MPFIAIYKSADPDRCLLGGVKKSRSSLYESRQDAEFRLASSIEIHKGLHPPLKVTGEVIEIVGPIDIYDDGSVRGCSWGKAKQARVNAQKKT